MNIRLTVLEQELLCIIFRKALIKSGCRKGEVRLFGSRTDIRKKGGDIDLLILVDNDVALNDLQQAKFEFMVELKQRLGDQKIDCIYALYSEKDIDPFLRSIYPSSVELLKINNE